MPIAVDHAIDTDAVEHQPTADVGRRAPRRGVDPDAAALAAQVADQRARATAQGFTQPAVDERRQLAVLGGGVLGLAGERVVDIERNAYLRAIERALDGLPPALEQRSALHQRHLLRAGMDVLPRKNLPGSGACASRKAAYFFLILGSSYKALTPCLAELRMTEDGLK
ncbi:hypothetical protein D3C71_1491730 [compost metagenome]